MTSSRSRTEELAQAVLGSRSFLAMLFPYNGLQTPQGSILVSTSGHGKPLCLAIYRLQEDHQLQHLWEGASCLMGVIKPYLVLFPGDSSGNRTPTFFDLDLRFPLPHYLELHTPLPPLRFVSAWNETIYAQDEMRRILTLSMDNGKAAIGGGPQTHSDLCTGPVACLFPDGRERLIFGVDGGVSVIDPESLQIEAAHSQVGQSCALHSIYPWSRGDLLLKENHTLTALRPDERSWEVLWKHPLRSWTNGVTYPVFIRGKIWYGTGDGRVFGVDDQGTICHQSMLQEFRPCISRGLAALGENQLLLAAYDGRLVLLDVIAETTESTHLMEITPKATEQSRIEGIWKVEEGILINWRNAGPTGGAWFISLIECEAGRFGPAKWTEGFGQLIKIFHGSAPIEAFEADRAHRKSRLDARF